MLFYEMDITEITVIINYSSVSESDVGSITALNDSVS